MDARYAADLDLARRCAAGDETAWERFVLDYRPVLYRAAQALDPGGGARDLADGLYAELYGIHDRGGPRRSLLASFQGRSSLAAWLRAVLAQRHVDRLRAERRLEPLPDGDDDPRRPAGNDPRASDGRAAPDPDRRRWVALVRRALGVAIASLSDRDRLRLGCYYVQELTLADTGRLLVEHEATVSRQLARTRRAIREDVERQLREEARLTADQMAECFASAAGDPGPIDLAEVLDAAARRKAPAREI